MKKKIFPLVFCLIQLACKLVMSREPFQVHPMTVWFITMLQNQHITQQSEPRYHLLMYLGPTLGDSWRLPASWTRSLDIARAAQS